MAGWEDESLSQKEYLHCNYEDWSFNPQHKCEELCIALHVPNPSIERQRYVDPESLLASQPVQNGEPPVSWDTCLKAVRQKFIEEDS